MHAIQRASLTDWKAAAFFLARKFHEATEVLSRTSDAEWTLSDAWRIRRFEGGGGF